MHTPPSQYGTVKQHAPQTSSSSAFSRHEITLFIVRKMSKHAYAAAHRQATEQRQSGKKNESEHMDEPIINVITAYCALCCCACVLWKLSGHCTLCTYTDSISHSNIYNIVNTIQRRYTHKRTSAKKNRFIIPIIRSLERSFDIVRCARCVLCVGAERTSLNAADNFVYC